MKLMLTTQIQENYGVHDWDGKGAVPQYWKFKGGNDYSYDLGPNMRNSVALNELVSVLGNQVTQNTISYRENVIDWVVVEDSYLTDFEKSQIEYDGKIIYPAQKLELRSINV